MGSALVAFDSGGAVERGIVTGFREAGYVVATWPLRFGEEPPGVPDVVIASRERLAEIVPSFKGGLSQSLVVVVVDDSEPSHARQAIRAGASVLVDRHIDVEELASLVVEHGGSLSFCPAGLLSALANRLEEPPVDMTSEEEKFLALATALTIEGVGVRIGLSRRQAQRRFKAICEKFGFAGHLEAAVAATRWGLSPHENQRVTDPMAHQVTDSRR